MKNLFTLLIFSFLCIGAVAQKASIRGQIREVAKKEGLFGATVMVEGTTTGAQTDFEGKFKLDIPAGKALTLIFRSVGYKSKQLALQPIPAGENRVLDMELEEDVKESKEVTVTVARRRDTDVSLINDIRKAEMVVNGVSSEQIAKTQDRDAAQVMQRVPGVTVVDNRFVMIRGISERYNSVMINDAISPGTEVDTRAFSFDLINSSMIERMMIFKSGAASLPGEFAGGVVKIYTKNTFGDDFLNVSLGSALRPNTTLHSAWRPEGSATDGLGFDNGTRTLSGSFPVNYKDLPASQQLSYAKHLNSNYSPRPVTNLPDLRFGISLGKRWHLGNKLLSTVSSLNYTSTTQNTQTSRYRYASWNEATQKSQDTLLRYSDQAYNQNIRISAISNWMLKYGRSKIELKNLFNQIGDNETVVRDGKIADRPTDLLRNYSYHYLSRSLLHSQVLGSHELNNTTNLDWMAAYSYTHRNEPDYRRIRTFKPEGSSQPYELIPAASSGAIFETGRFYSALSEHVGSASATLSKQFSVGWDSTKAILRTGFYTEAKSRQFSARYFVYLLKNPGQNQDLLTLSLDKIFAPENLTANKFVLEEGTRPEDSYQSQNLLGAAFAEVSLPLKKWRLTAGFRPEYNRQSLQSATAVKKVSVKNPILSPLGFANLSWNFSEKWVARAAYSKTVNRPEFRELAPFVYYDFNLDVNFVGNPNLKVADIHNVDGRLEFYPTAGELISIGGFYKHFVNPIETKVQPVGLSPQFTYSNANSANNYGIEVELRKCLGEPGGSRVVDQLFVVSNASLIRSRVDLGVVGSQERIRALQGQSPYVVNGGLFFSRNSYSITALYNVVGMRIFMVGDATFPSIYEMPRHVVDLSLSKQLGRRYHLKLGVNDLLNYRSRFIQDSNRDGKITGSDELISSFQRGAYYTFAVAVNL